jgi:hypothetical protein
MSNNDLFKLGAIILAAVIIGGLVVDYLQEKKVKQMMAENAKNNGIEAN